MGAFKNTLIIEIDSEAEQQVMISKPEEVEQPTTVEETINMMSKDFKTLCITIYEMAYVGHTNGYFDGKETLNNCIKELERYKESIDARNNVEDENVQG